MQYTADKKCQKITYCKISLITSQAKVTVEAVEAMEGPPLKQRTVYSPPEYPLYTTPNPKIAVGCAQNPKKTPAEPPRPGLPRNNFMTHVLCAQPPASPIPIPTHISIAHLFNCIS